jgi:ferrous iron transport protein B
MRSGRNINSGKGHGAGAVGTPHLRPVRTPRDDDALYIALAGNPNSGKTTVFNALTGSRQKTANYAGVTIEKKEGLFRTPGGRAVRAIDLPGLYSLTAGSPEEQIAQEVLLGAREDTVRPDVTIVVVDASNMERNLYLALQLKEIGVPVIVALNMMDIARDHGLEIDTGLLSRRVGMPVVEMSAKTGLGIEELRSTLDEMSALDTAGRPWTMDGETERVIAKAADVLIENGLANDASADWLARQCLFRHEQVRAALPEEIEGQILALRARLNKSDDDLLDDEVINRYRWIRRLYADAVCKPGGERRSRSELIDSLILHKYFGPVIFVIIMGLMFQAIFSWSEVPMGWIESGVASLGDFIGTNMPDGELKNLLLDGVIAGVGNVIIFLPQIVFLFFFIALLEDTGYMARAAFLMDRLMGRVGLNGHAFIPLLSSFACAIPGIMSTRTIRSDKDRLVTIMVAPLMTCAARLPVYTLLIAAFFPPMHLFGIFSLRGLIMLSLYLGGIFAALGVAWVLRRFIVKGERSPLILEMPSYKVPQVRNVRLTVWNASWAFLRKAGTIILVMTVILWFLISHPANQELEQSLLNQGIPQDQVQRELVRHSYMGQVGQFIEPAIQPLGYDWKIGVGLISAFAAREVIVGTLAIIYSAGSEEETAVLKEAMQRDTYPGSKRPVWTPLVAASLLTFFVFALMCVSTIAVIRKETNSWKWPAIAFGYMLVLSYVAALVVYQGGRLLGLA